MYNISHAYGLEGKKENQHAKLCRNIITTPPPKGDEAHGCPFAHWRTADLTAFLRSHYSLTQPQIQEITRETDLKHFQVACGRLFEAVNLPPPSPKDPHPVLPIQIAKKLAKSPHDFFFAGFEMTALKNGQPRGSAAMEASKLAF